MPIGFAAGGKQSATIAGELADVLVATEPLPELVEPSRPPAERASRRSRRCRSASAPTRRPPSPGRTAVPLVRPGLEGQRRAARHAGFDAASQFVREEDVESSIPCGDDVAAVIEAAKEYADAGFTHLALVQIGGDQQEPYLEWTRSALLPAWREAFGS